MKSNHPISFPPSIELKVESENLKIHSQNSHKVIASDFGIGARFTLNVMSDKYKDIILTALNTTDKTNLIIETDTVSTYVAGKENDIIHFIMTVISKVAQHGHHVSVMILLSRGCPGEVNCQIPNSEFFPIIPAIQLHSTGIHVVAQWSLYPLFDERHGDFSHMDEIYRAIDYAKEKGVYKKSCHYVTELEGDLADVFQVITEGWLLVGKTVQHVTTHVTLSINSPTLNHNLSYNK